MGRLLRTHNSSAAIAATLAAIVIPCALWYLIGTRQLEQVVSELHQGAEREAVTTAMQLATKVSLQLDDLVRAESERSPLEYFPVYRWRGSRCGKARVRQSPLAHGDYPYALKFYFQIDEQGRIGGPRVDVDLAALEVPTRGPAERLHPVPGYELWTPAPATESSPSAGLGASGVVPSTGRPWHLASFVAGDVGHLVAGPDMSRAARPTRGTTPNDAQSDGLEPAGRTPLPGRGSELDALLGDGHSYSDDDPNLPASDDAQDIGPFRWLTGTWRGEPTLIAVRNVTLRDRAFTQGFAVETRSLSDWMFNGGFPAKLLPGPATIATAAMLPTGGVDWHVAFDPRPALDGVRRQEATLRSQFRTTYFGGLLAALLAGTCVVALVWRSGRLARERARFAAAAAHELRTPLAGIRLHGEMLAASLGNPASIQRYAQRIVDEAERLARIVTNVLSHTRQEQRRLTLNRQKGDLAATVEACLANIQPLLAEAGAELVIEITPTLEPVAFDADAIHQILRNLIDNAEKYTRKASDRRIEVRVLRGQPSGARIEVIDHGPGIAPGLRARLFQPFVTADTESKHAGLGLGLSVVWALVAAHGGRVQALCTPGGGATFVVELP